jgi:hypothetical protein
MLILANPQAPERTRLPYYLSAFYTGAALVVQETPSLGSPGTLETVTIMMRRLAGTSLRLCLLIAYAPFSTGNHYEGDLVVTTFGAQSAGTRPRILIPFQKPITFRPRLRITNPLARLRVVIEAGQSNNELAVLADYRLDD